MISKEQYLQAKKTIADYELQEYQSHPGLSSHAGNNKENKEKFLKMFAKGELVEYLGKTYKVETHLEYDDTNMVFVIEEAGKEPAREKSPLQDAMDRGYRKGAVMNAYGERYKILFDPVLSGKMVMAAVQGRKDTFKFDMPIWIEGLGTCLN